MEKKYSRGYKLICRFFKELGFYSEFLEYQRNGSKYVQYRCDSIPIDTITPIRAFGGTSLTSWFKDARGIHFKFSLYEMFQVWSMTFCPWGLEMHSSLMNLPDKNDVLNIKKKRIKVKDIILKKPNRIRI